MKNLLPLLSLTLMVSACDTPQRTRLTTPVNSSANGVAIPTGTLGTGTPTTGTTTSGTTTGTTTSGTTTGGTGFENCDLTGKHYAAGVGYVGLCQSTIDETLFKFKPTTTDQSIRTCLIPLYKDTSGSSTYLGQAQCTLTTANAEVQGNLYRTRTVNGQTLSINGVFVVKESAIVGGITYNLLNEYLKCADGYTDFLAKACAYGSRTDQACYALFMRCPNGANTNSACANEAMSWRTQVCTNFKSNFGSYYIDVRTKN